MRTKWRRGRKRRSKSSLKGDKLEDVNNMAYCHLSWHTVSRTSIQTQRRLTYTCKHKHQPLKTLFCVLKKTK